MRVLKRAKGVCEICGKNGFLWVTPRENILDWDGMNDLSVDAPPVEKASVIGVCWRCSPNVLKPATEYAESLRKKYQQTALALQ